MSVLQAWWEAAQLVRAQLGRKMGDFEEAKAAAEAVVGSDERVSSVGVVGQDPGHVAQVRSHWYNMHKAV